ncbi:D-aminoacyl-tRNA deacylase [Janibacter cremeus]|uniref:D-aminoacyl-tRNA deacylase n=1 Tax=Janibacter cremeus TaxID=1285192 RepID=A0A852VLJ4_9MICO|nr:D-aminoacyl-tRNA deacylase [Janibacter cremeus]NYF97947.1 D-tyrosyl-tRNA(Tyr) deacylase [Janibacter cremeus]
MRTVVQRVSSARVRVGEETVGEIGPGLVALVGVTHEDGPREIATTVRKIAELRIMSGETSVTDSGGAVLVVSQFTLHADIRKGRRPSWNAAAPGPVAEPVVDAVAEGLRERGLTVATGRFGADMAVDIHGDGPVTLIIDAPA